MSVDFPQCGPDGCAVDWDDLSEKEPAWEAKKKLDSWLTGLEPIDYDAPGTTARETGV